MKTTAIYARVSSDRQKEDGTIESQINCLLDYAKTHDLVVPSSWIFKDEGYSGKNLLRPDLERLRDLIAEGQIEEVLVYAPDRLSRQYAYQYLLVEEFNRAGARIVFLKSPGAETPEGQLLLQFQGMIAEYERAQITERTRRGKLHRAKSGKVNVLSNAPYGYRYVKKTPDCDAYLQVIETEAVIVRQIFQLYVKDQLSVNGIARQISQQGTLTRKGKLRWDRTTVWGMLRNPAYMGLACYGKTEKAERQKITRPLRIKGGFSPVCGSTRERPRQDWIEIPVPVIVEPDTFELAQELMARNAKRSPRRSKVLTLLQGMLICGECSYVYYRTSTRTSKGMIYYYRCLGSDAYRFADGAVCSNRPIRQDILDQLVWDQITELLEEPTLIQKEIECRLQMANQANPNRKRKDDLTRELNQVQKARRNLINAYQEDLMGLEELRERMPSLKKREQSVEAELQSFAAALADDQLYLRVVNSLDSFREVIRNSRSSMGVRERQKVLRLLVKDILVYDSTVKIRHSIPVKRTRADNQVTEDGDPEPPCYLLHGRRHNKAWGQATYTSRLA